MTADFKTLLERRCESLGISQREVSRRSGISVSYLTKLKNHKGREIPFSKKRKQLRLLAETLEISIEELQDAFVSKSAYIDNTLSRELHEDNRIKEIVEKWMESEEQEKEMLYKIFTQLCNLSLEEQQETSESLDSKIVSSWPHAKESDSYKPHSEERALFIWKQACEDCGVGAIFNQSIADKEFRRYRTRNLTDAKLYRQLIETIENIKESLK